MNIAVTGGNGRFGQVLISHLIQHRHTVLNIDRALPPAQVSGTETTADTGNRLSAITLDMTDLSALIRALHGCDALIHLAAVPSPLQFPEPEVYANNTLTSYNALYAAAECGINKICLASSINAIGGAYSRVARYDYFPLDERHPTYNEDAYSLSKWVMEAQADSFARRCEGMTIASLRLHGLYTLTARRTLEDVEHLDATMQRRIVNHLWGYTDIHAAAQACLAALNAKFTGHETFFIVAPTTIFREEVRSRDLARRFYPDVPINGALESNAGFYSCAKAERLLGWRHNDVGG